MTSPDSIYPTATKDREPLSVATVTMDIAKYGVTVPFGGPDGARRWTVTDATRRFGSDDPLFVHLEREVHRQKIADATARNSRTVRIQIPLGTWQMFKEIHRDAWWLNWLVRRRPVLTRDESRVVEVITRWEGWATFPDSTIVVRNDALGSPFFQLESTSEAIVFREGDK